MLLHAKIQPFDWPRIFLSEDSPPLFLLEVALRCFFMYLMVIAALRVTGRRGVRQLSIFELSIILGLGSAAGDAMLYQDTPLLHAVVVFAVVSGLYVLFNRLTEKYPRFSDWLEGKPVLLVEDGQIQLKNFRSQNLTQKELFGELRQLQVEHLGQVRRAYIEATGYLSVYFYDEQEPVLPGLPIWPEKVGQTHKRVTTSCTYACACCGKVQQISGGDTARCPVCAQTEWVPACQEKRVA
jgi:uncharacterized membrane protein YcaP (DUF421 family)